MGVTERGVLPIGRASRDEAAFHGRSRSRANDRAEPSRSAAAHDAAAGQMALFDALAEERLQTYRSLYKWNYPTGRVEARRASGGALVTTLAMRSNLAFSQVAGVMIDAGSAVNEQRFRQLPPRRYDHARS